MNSITSTRPKISKSRIPVAVRSKKSPIVNNKKSLNKLATKIQTSSSYKTTNSCLLPKESSSQLVKSNKSKNDIKSSKLKGNAQSPVKSNIKLNCTKVKEMSVRTDAKVASIKGKDLILKTKQKSDGSKGASLSSFKNNLKCLQKRENVSTLKTGLKSNDPFKMLSIPKITFEKENQSPNNCFTSQKDIKFEANEMYRNMILREQEISPSVCNLLPGLRMSSILSERPSVYQKFEVPPDPFKEAMQALANISLSVKRESKTAKQPKAPSSPFRDRGSFYTPGVDPKMEVMKSLQKFKLKQLQKSASKSTKKVTFDLNIKECTPRNTCDTELKSFKNSDSRLTQINEKSEENTPNSPRNDGEVDTFSSKEKSESFQKAVDNKSDRDLINKHEVEVAVGKGNTKHGDACGTLCISIIKPATTTTADVNSQKLSPVQQEGLVFHSLKETCPITVSSNLHYGNIEVLDMTSTKHQTPTKCHMLEQINLNDENIKNTRAKVYTPRPVSLYSKHELMNSSSPEFLEKGASETLLKFAPICTPLVLKSVAKGTALSPPIDLSPVRLKLDFSEKETPKNKTLKKSTLLNLGNIMTSKNKLDELADEECCLWFLNENVPVVCGRYLTDPVAVTLNEGDEMHFIPIQF